MHFCDLYDIYCIVPSIRNTGIVIIFGPAMYCIYDCSPMEPFAVHGLAIIVGMHLQWAILMLPRRDIYFLN